MKILKKKGGSFDGYKFLFFSNIIIFNNSFNNNNIERIQKKMVYKKKDKTEKDCPKCSSKLYNEVIEEIDYPYVCLKCDENFYNFEIKERG